MHTKQSDENHFSGKIVTVFDLLTNSSLCIPAYQRPYKWTEKNVTQLLSDSLSYYKKSAYRLGSVVLHKDKQGMFNIVDGQQRTLSLILCVHALLIKDTESPLKDTKLRKQLGQLKKQMIMPEFSNQISKNNIRQNYLAIRRIISRPDFTEQQISFLLNQCEVILITLTDVSEAFQFFDSQNARGRDLEPHDLLKAFHLREFSPADETRKATAVEKWEAIAPQHLKTLFAGYLFHIRQWSDNDSARYFTKQDVNLFKGVNINTAARYPYTQQLHIIHQFVDHYNAQYERTIDEQSLNFPFQLDQKIINGRRFFDFVSHYQQQVAHYNTLFKNNNTPDNSIKLSGFAPQIISVINSYEGRSRKGDRYVRMLFDCLLIFYLDKFGNSDLSSAIEKIFIWAYNLRLSLYSVKIASADSYVLNHNLFRQLKTATTPDDFLRGIIPTLKDIKSGKTRDIESLFTKMKYYAP